MRKIIQLLTLLTISISFSSCIEMIIVGRFLIAAKNSPYCETYTISIDKDSLAVTDSLLIEFVNGQIPRNISDNSTIYYDNKKYTLDSEPKNFLITVSKKVNSKIEKFMFFDDAICTDTIRLYKNDTLIVEWDKATIDTYHNIYNHNEWTARSVTGCWQNGSYSYDFLIKQEDIEKWKNEK